MKLFPPVIKWTGSKRKQSYDIFKHFPSKIDTYYEPFLGGGSVLYRLLSSDIEVNKIVCSDINGHLISLWDMIQNDPQKLSDGYRNHWYKLNVDDNGDRRKDYYYKIRDKFNKEHDPIDFFFLTRTSTNGLVRYNRSGQFNTSFHFSRKGIQPNTLDKIVKDWSNKINKFDIDFIQQSFNLINPKKDDFIYFDPPYINTKSSMYQSNTIDYDDFFSFLSKLPCGFLLSFDGKQGDIDNTYKLPKELYDEHIYLDSGISSFKRLKDNDNYQVQESLYIKH